MDKKFKPKHWNDKAKAKSEWEEAEPSAVVEKFEIGEKLEDFAKAFKPLRLIQDDKDDLEDMIEITQQLANDLTDAKRACGIGQKGTKAGIDAYLKHVDSYLTTLLQELKEIEEGEILASETIKGASEQDMRSGKVYKTLIAKMSADRSVLRAFVVFAKKELSSENVDFLEELLANTTRNDRDSQRIFSTYIPTGAQKSINIKAKTRQDLIDSVEPNPDYDPEKLYDPDDITTHPFLNPDGFKGMDFSQALKEILKLIEKDTLGRFVFEHL